MIIKHVDVKNDNVNEIALKYNIDTDLLFDVQDSSETARLLEKSDYTEIIIKYPIKNEVVTLGVYLKKDMIIFLHTEDFPFELSKSFKSTNMVLIDVMYQISESYFKIFKNVDKKIRKIKSSSKTSVKNVDLLSLFELQNDLDDYVIGIKGNLLVLNKLTAMIPNNEFVNDTKIEIGQTLETAISYSKTVSNLKDTLNIITNNITNKRMESLTIVNVSALTITSMSGLYGMNVKLPFSDIGNVFFYIIFVSVVLAFGFGFYLKRKFSEKK